MSEDGITQYEQAMIGQLTHRVSRTQFLTTTGAAAVLAALPGAASAQTTAPEDLQTILNTALTAEHLAVTLLTAAVNNATQLGLTGLVLATVQAALVEEQLHADFLTASGGKPITDTFTIPDPKILTDQKTFLHLLADTAEPLFIAAYMAAVREFTALGQPLLAKIAVQIGATEAEHRVMARAALALSGDASGIPPNNKGFETNLLATVGDAAKQLISAGFINGTGQQVTYPGAAAAFAAASSVINAAVIQRVPNTSTPGVLLSATPVHAPHPQRRRSHRARPHR